MTVAFMVTKKNIFTMCGVYVSPVLHSLFDGGRCRVLVIVEADTKLLKYSIKLWISTHESRFEAKIAFFSWTVDSWIAGICNLIPTNRKLDH
jgi:hypothetical protein